MWVTVCVWIVAEIITELNKKAMSKRCKLQKEYYKEFGNYKGSGKYTNHYVKWLESKFLAINYTRCCTELCDETENNRKNSSIATYTENSKPEHYA